MKRRVTISGKASKGRQRKTKSPKCRTAPAVARRSGSPDIDLKEQLDQRTGELVEARKLLAEALEQQAATSEVLGVISSSPGELEPVFDAILQNATRICEAQFGNLFLREGDKVRAVAVIGIRSFVDSWRHNPVMDLVPNTPSSRVLGTGQIVQILDMREDEGYLAGNPRTRELVEIGGARTFISFPMMKDDQAIGTIGMYRQEVRPFSDKQIELMRNFAKQAVIAIENSRLLNELRESLQQQTATADVLKVISRSTFDLEVVFKTLVESAVMLCRADRGTIRILREGAFHQVATSGFSPEQIEFMKSRPSPNDRTTVAGRVAQARVPVHIPDVTSDNELSFPWASQSMADVRTLLGIPLMREGNVIGLIVLSRGRVEPFNQRQIELVSTFADQAVIAIENARLFTEVKDRTEDLEESLQQQTATADVLKVISRSTFDLQTVLDTLTESVARLCDADMAAITRQRSDGQGFNHVTNYNFPPDWIHYNTTISIAPNRGSVVGRVLLDGKAVQVPDVFADSEYAYLEPARKAGYRTFLGVPLLSQGQPIGVVTMGRNTVAPFSDKQIELAQTFADQAVIAIENTRLLNELRDTLQQQTASNEVLSAMSRSTFDLHPVLASVLESAIKLCGANRGHIFRTDGDFLRFAAASGAWAGFTDYLAEHPLRIGDGSAAGRAAARRQLVQINDVLTESDYEHRELVKQQGYRTVLAVPMLRDDEALGVITILKSKVEPFTAKQIELVNTFANQAVIAIDNTRLLTELRQRTDDLSESLQQQTATADVLKVISRSTFDLQTVLQTLVESAVKLCEADQGTIAQSKADKVFHRTASFGFSPKFTEYLKRFPVTPEPGSAIGRALLEGRTIHIPDIDADPDYTFHDAKRLGGFRTILAVPMLREGVAIGVLALTRTNPRPFLEKQIELVSTFADQAAIAIENVRLFDSVQARTRELATSLEELGAAQDRLIQTEKLASLGQLTAGIAHEIKNPLNFVNNFSAVSVELVDELREALSGAHLEPQMRTEINELAEMLRGNLDKIIQHGKRADSIVKNMLLHSRQGSGEHRAVDINALVEESLNLAYHGARAEKEGFNITLERSFDPAAGEVGLFPQEITRVLLNLISNGFYAAIKRQAEGNGSAFEPTLLAATKNLGNSVEISIRDNGTGIAPDVKERMFNPFFTTKPAGEGTGLGLSLSHDIIVKQHAGSIEVDTQPGEYTEFKIILPRSAGTIAKPGGRS